MAGELTFLTVPLGDWMQAAGAALGVAATIAATLAIERWRARAPDRDNQKRYREALSLLDVAALHVAERAARTPIPTGNDLNAFVSAGEALLRAIGGYRFVRRQIEPRDLVHWNALTSLEAILDRVEPELEREWRILGRDDNQAEVARIAVDSHQRCAQAIRAMLTHTLAQFTR